MFNAGQKVVITSKVGTHVAEDAVGVVVRGPHSFMGTYVVEVGGRGYGFLPTELIPLSDRLEYLRGEIDAERISTGELIELEGYAEFIEPGDVQLLEAAGVPEFPEDGYEDPDYLPYLTGGVSSTECLDAGLVCSIDPPTRRCTECGQRETFAGEY